MLPSSSIEQIRLDTLHSYAVLDAPTDDELDAVVRIATVVAGVPYATLNLIDENRQCQLTTVGFEGTTSSRDDSMCALYFADGHVIVSDDASVDPRYMNNPWVTGALGSVRFYVSTPLRTPEGPILGTLCLFDTQPGSISQEQIRRLEDLANVIVALFERRKQAREIEASHNEIAKREVLLQAAVADLQRSNHDLQHFASVASHDLASPLTTIGGYIELLGDMYEERLDETAMKWINVSLDGVRRMNALIQALLSYAQAGSEECHRTQVSLSEVLQGALTDLRTDIDRSNVRIETPTQLPVIEGDSTLLRQLLQNLVGNAIKYRDHSRECIVEVSTHVREGAWELVVTDNGIGIPMEARRHVFEPFTRSNTEAASGHGIGLATCRRIVERHGGDIWIDPDRTTGTAVHFTIPAAGVRGPQLPVEGETSMSEIR